MVHCGLEGLEATNRLIRAACAPGVVLCDHLYRVALTDAHCEQLRATAKLLPEIATWLEPAEVPYNDNSKIRGAVRLQNGCQVLHVPSYLRGLWKACKALGSVQWKQAELGGDEQQQFDAVVYAAGSGLFLDSEEQPLLSAANFPMTLVRGQSLEIDVAMEEHPALLCGKYISPTPEPGVVLVGATHEFQSVPMNQTSVARELRERTYETAPWIWRDGQIRRRTSGVRVQSERGSHGRLPMLGRLVDNHHHPNTWIFTGLSSRGLLYHGLYGSLLADAILANDDTILNSEGLLWWTKDRRVTSSR